MSIPLTCTCAVKPHGIGNALNWLCKESIRRCCGAGSRFVAYVYVCMVRDKWL